MTVDDKNHLPFSGTPGGGDDDDESMTPSPPSSAHDDVKTHPNDELVDNKKNVVNGRGRPTPTSLPTDEAEEVKLLPIPPPPPPPASPEMMMQGDETPIASGGKSSRTLQTTNEKDGDGGTKSAMIMNNNNIIINNTHTTSETSSDIEEGGGGGDSGVGVGKDNGMVANSNNNITKDPSSKGTKGGSGGGDGGVHPRPEMNPKFKDVHETGKWGDLSKREMYVASGIFAIILIVVAVVVAVVVTGNNNTSLVVPAPTASPTAPPTPISASDELALVRAAIASNPSTMGLLVDLPVEATVYETYLEEEEDGDDASGGVVTTTSPQRRAMAWLLYEDTYKDPVESARRWALASLYYQTGGSTSWTSTTGWLQEDSICTWEGISCDRNGSIQELDLDQRNLVSNSVPIELALLGDNIRSILMRDNQMGGTIPGQVFAGLPRLGFLYLNGNRLTGTVPEGLTEMNGLHTLYVQFNDLTGSWPAEYCSEVTTIREFGLDCDKISNCTCCSPLECYYSDS